MLCLIASHRSTLRCLPADDDTDDAVDPRVAELESPEEAYAYSVEFCRSHINLYNQVCAVSDARLATRPASTMLGL